jgi:hypothetical protein
LYQDPGSGTDSGGICNTKLETWARIWDLDWSLVLCFLVVVCCVHVLVVCGSLSCYAVFCLLCTPGPRTQDYQDQDQDQGLPGLPGPGLGGPGPRIWIDRYASAFHFAFSCTLFMYPPQTNDSSLFVASGTSSW